MKKIEFKAKYSNSIIEIAVDMHNEAYLLPPKPTVRTKVANIYTICEEMILGFEVNDKVASFRGEILTTYIFDPNLRTRDLPLKYTFETFIADWELVRETEQKEKEEQDKEKYKEIEQSLRQLSIETDSFERVTESPMITLKNLKEKGFIQGTTTRTISLWWHVNGERVVFICGQGIFKLSQIK